MTRDVDTRPLSIEDRLLKQRSRRLLGNVLKRRMLVDAEHGYNDELQYNFARRAPNDYHGKGEDIADALEKLKAMQQNILRANAHKKPGARHHMIPNAYTSPNAAKPKFPAHDNKQYEKSPSISQGPFLSSGSNKSTKSSSNGQAGPVQTKSSARSAISNALFQSMNFKQFKKNEDQNNNNLQAQTSEHGRSVRLTKNRSGNENRNATKTAGIKGISHTTTHLGKVRSQPISNNHQDGLNSSNEVASPITSRMTNSPHSNSVGSGRAIKENTIEISVKNLNDERKQTLPSSLNGSRASQFRIKKISIAGAPQEPQSSDNPTHNYVTGVKLYKQLPAPGVTINLFPIKSQENAQSPIISRNRELQNGLGTKDNNKDSNVTKTKGSVESTRSAGHVKGKEACHATKITVPHVVTDKQANVKVTKSQAKEIKKEEKNVTKHGFTKNDDATTNGTSENHKIPRFYFPTGKPRPKGELEITMQKISEACSVFEDRMVPLEQMGAIAKACNVSNYWKGLIFHAAAGDSEATKVSEEAIKATWKRIASTNNDLSSRFVSLLAKPGKSCLDFEDFLPLLKDIVDSHPGLIFLKDAPEFHTRYMNTVIARIFYVVNRSWSGQITAGELRKSNFLTVLSLLEEEEDINAITDYFSYEHFYVIYCKFWELDTDHDLVIDKHDLIGYGDGVLSSRLIDRVLSGAVTRWDTSDHQLGKMSYVDFVWFILSEEDKKSQTSIEYWFRCMDLDGDGVISMYEMEYFYEEQAQKLEQLDIEPLPFEDCVCQVLDIVNPNTDGKVSLRDLKKCKMAHVFFDTFFNVAKYLTNEQKDPFAAQNADDGSAVVISDWDNFAAEEYELLVAEEQSNKLSELSSPLLDSDHLDVIENHTVHETNERKTASTQYKPAKINEEIVSELDALNFRDGNVTENMISMAQT